MEANNKHIQDISDIRNMMERASKFISLSGISGVSAGIVALIGVSIAFWYLNFYIPGATAPVFFKSLALIEESIVLLCILALLTFITAFSLAIFFTTKNSKKKNIPVWDYSSKRILIHLVFPIGVCACFILSLIYYGAFILIIPVSLIFYGFSLINAGNFTFRDIKILGFIEIFLGLLAILLPALGLYIWALGFGILHIVYGIIMYFKYEK